MQETLLVVIIIAMVGLHKLGSWQMKLIVRSEVTNALKEIQEITYIDELTGLPNRRGLKLMIRPLFARMSKPDKTPRISDLESVYVVAVDIDGLKQVNDGISHEAGDIFIQTVAGCIQNNIRASDILARLGGDEFVVIFPDSTEEQVNFAMKDARIELEERLPGYSFSHGVAGEVEVVDPDMYTYLYGIADIRCHDHKVASGKQRSN